MRFVEPPRARWTAQVISSFPLPGMVHEPVTVKTMYVAPAIPSISVNVIEAILLGLPSTSTCQRAPLLGADPEPHGLGGYKVPKQLAKPSIPYLSVLQSDRYFRDRDTVLTGIFLSSA